MIETPGSPGAILKGCTCPTLDNAHGKGVNFGDTEPLFWIDGLCPLHGVNHIEEDREEIH